MIKVLKRNLIKRQANTLVELLSVVGILGVLASVSVANYKTYKERANDGVAISGGRAALTALQVFISDQPSYNTSMSLLVNALGTQTLSGGVPGTNYLPGYKHNNNSILEIIFSSFGSGFIITSYHCKGTSPSSTPSNRSAYVFQLGRKMTKISTAPDASCGTGGGY